MLGLELAHLLLAGNDTVPISTWRGGGMHSAECPLVSHFYRATLYADALYDMLLSVKMEFFFHQTSPQHSKFLYGRVLFNNANINDLE